MYFFLPRTHLSEIFSQSRRGGPKGTPLGSLSPPVSLRSANVHACYWFCIIRPAVVLCLTTLHLTKLQFVWCQVFFHDFCAFRAVTAVRLVTVPAGVRYACSLRSPYPLATVVHICCAACPRSCLVHARAGFLSVTSCVCVGSLLRQ